MAKLVYSALWVVLALGASTGPAVAQIVPGGAGEALCQAVVGGFVIDQSGGLFPIGPASCSLGGEAEGKISVQPTVALSAEVDANGIDPGNRNGIVANVELQYSFTLTGGNPGDLVPVLVQTSMFTDVSSSDDPNNSNTASALLDLFALSGVGGRIIGNGPGVSACAVSPDSGGCFPEVDDILEVTMASGSAELVFMQILVAASANSGGHAAASVDPFIFVDPSFANAASYTITVSDGVANALPVPEPSIAALLLPGLGVVALARRRRRNA